MEIPQFWRIETETGRPTLSVFRLVDREYKLMGQPYRDVTVALDGPWPVSLDLKLLP